MFGVRRIVRSQLSLNKYLYTSSRRCDKPKDPKSEGNDEPKLKKTSTKSGKPRTISVNANRKKLTAEVNAKDYANFKSKTSHKVEFYPDNKSSKNEKSEATAALQSLTEGIKKEVSVDTRINSKLIPLARPKQNVEAEPRSKLVKSARSVASELGGDVKKTEEDILGYLKTLKFKTEKRKSEQDNAGMINKEKQTPQRVRADRGQHFTEKPGFFRDRWTRSQGREVALADTRQEGEHSQKGNQNYGQTLNGTRRLRSQITDFIIGNSVPEPLGIFNATEFKDDGLKLKTWDELEELELKAAGTVPPRNYFEELIQWTEEGKLWHFPIDNDQDNVAEANVDFTEHVFLEEYLEPWCPKRGPLRHFMELVVTGLAKNHYFSVEEKKEHIYWYRDYFEAKKKLLHDMGILRSSKVLPESAESNSVPESPA